MYIKTLRLCLGTRFNAIKIVDYTFKAEQLYKTVTKPGYLKTKAKFFRVYFGGL